MWQSLSLKIKVIVVASIAGIVLAIAYGCWLKLGPTPVKPGQTVTAPAAPAVSQMPTTTVAVPRLKVIKDPVKAAAKLKIDPPLPQEQIQSAVTVPHMPYGGTATVFVNTTTGASREVIKANESPLFAFRRDNAIGIGYGIGTEGQTYSARYRRDVAQIKAVTISGEIEGNYAERRYRPVEGRLMIWGEARW